VNATARITRAPRGPAGAAWERLAGPGQIHAGLLVAALAAWSVSLTATDVRGMTDFGLVSVLPGWYYVALALLTVSFCIAMRSPQPHWSLLGVHVVILLVMLHGTPAILYGTLRYAWAWKHVGVVDYIVRHGSVNLNLGQLTAYQDWPAFFAFAALIVKVGGFGSALAFASWAPLFNNLLFASVAMFVIRSLTSDRRLAWLAVWIFCATNWVGQDYFSPQATNYFLYLVVLGICLRWFAPRVVPSARTAQRWLHFRWLSEKWHTLVERGQPEIRVPASAVRTAPALAAIVITLAAAIVTSHQLTPFMLILSLTALVIFQLCGLRGLPLLVALMTGAWAMYMALAFLKGNLYWIIQSIGSLNIGSSTLSNLAKASPDHVVVAEVARLFTALVGVLGIAGLVRRLRHGRLDLTAVLLAGAPVLMVWGNAYGGEVLFRIYFFALPFLAFLAAGLVFPTPLAGRSWLGAAGTLALSVPLLVGMLISYYGNERMYYFSHDEVRSAQYLVAHAPAGSTLVGFTTAYPWGYRDYELYNYVQISTLPPSQVTRLINDPVPAMANLVYAASRGHEYVVFSRAQDAEMEMTGVMPVNGARRIEAALSASRRFWEVYRGPDAQIFALVGSGGAG
jgi:hypothetical protein